MGINIGVKCNGCVKEIKIGETFLNLKGQYMNLEGELVADGVQPQGNDKLRNFWALCDSCRSLFLKKMALDTERGNKELELIYKE